MQLVLAELAMRRFKDEGSDIHWTTSAADQRFFVAAEVTEVKDGALQRWFDTRELWGVCQAG